MKTEDDRVGRASSVMAMRRYQLALKDVKNPEMTLAAIAKKHGVSVSTAHKWRQRAGVRTRRGIKPMEEPKGWQSDYASGMSLREIGRKYGVSDMSVLKWRRRAGLEPRRRGRIPGRKVASSSSKYPW